jgi:hypothetical protein
VFACLSLLAPTIAHPVPHPPRQAITTAETPAALPSPATDRRPPVFKSAVDLVTVAALVRDARGRLVRNLARTDFQAFERGRERATVDFQASDHGPVSLAILFDVSGSMRGQTQHAGSLPSSTSSGGSNPRRTRSRAIPSTANCSRT